ncbi:hypothetical protein ABT040_32440 [Streptomyces sp. NPDC002688]|uniref:WD40 repeat domain-containing protein n=1 Tax=Streptomyces sp. NPDC002688 TaxID=3154423 RepID=UPI003329D810
MRTPWGIWGDWRWRRFEERGRAREAAELLPETGHEDWGDDRIGTALTTVFNLRESLDARRLSALRPGVELGVAEVKEAWAGMDGGPYAFTLNLLERLRDVRLVTIAPAADGRMRLTVPEGLRDRLRSRWTADEEAEWHERLLDNARVLARPGGTWLDLPVLAGYWWRNLIWHLWHCDPEKAAALVVYPSWQIARIQRLEVRGPLADLALVDSPESRATASVIDEVLSRLDPAVPHDPRGLAEELLQALGLAEQVVVAQRPPAHHAVLHLPVWTQDFAMSPDSTWLVAVGRDKRIRIYAVNRLGMAPDGSWIAIGDLYGIRVLDLPGGDERFTVEQRGTDFATTEDWLAVPDRERVQIRSTRTGELLNTLELHTENIQECHLSPDRKYLLTTDREGTLIMWDAAAVVP